MTLKQQQNNYNCVRYFSALGLPTPVPEYKFHPIRKWRFDFAWINMKIAMECEGGTWIKDGGRHNRPKGYKADMEKYNQAQLLGWIILRYESLRKMNIDELRQAIEMRCIAENFRN